MAKGAAQDPLLASVGPVSWRSRGSLYKMVDLHAGTNVLLTGSTVEAGKPISQPVAWSHTSGKSRVFYTSLGHVDDFKQRAFNRLLLNALFWAANRPIPDPAPMK